MDEGHQGKILLMLSGGIESTYLLYDYLRNSSRSLHAHHISIRNKFHQRWKAEDPACDRIVAWCRKNERYFEYSTSRFDLDMAWTGWDSDLQLLVASKVALNLGHHPVTVVVGWSADDLRRPGVRERHERDVTPRVWRALWTSIGEPDHIDDEVALPLARRGLTKADLINRLPPELLALTWSCRRPVLDGTEPRACGTCHACKLRTEAEARSEKGSTR